MTDEDREWESFRESEELRAWDLERELLAADRACDYTPVDAHVRVLDSLGGTP